MRSLLTYEEVERYNTFRKPDWRYQLVLRLAGSRLAHRTRLDEFTADFCRYYKRLKAAEDTGRIDFRLIQERPEYYYALKLYKATGQDATAINMIECRILARQDSAQIAKAASTQPAVIDTYEKLFFNVRDRLESQDYIVREAIVPSFLRPATVPGGVQNDNFDDVAYPTIADCYFDASMRVFAYFGGPRVLEPFLRNCHLGELPASPGAAETWITEYWKKTTERRLTQALARTKLYRKDLEVLYQSNIQLISVAKMAQNNGGIPNDTAGQLHDMLMDLSKYWVVRNTPIDPSVSTVMDHEEFKQRDNSASEPRAMELLGMQQGRLPQLVEHLSEMPLPGENRKKSTDKP